MLQTTMGRVKLEKCSCLQTHHLTGGTGCNTWAGGFSTPWQEGKWSRHIPVLVQNHGLRNSVLPGGLTWATASATHRKSFSLKFISLSVYIYGKCNYGNFKASFLVFKPLAEVFACTIAWLLLDASNGVRSNRNNTAIKTPQVNVLFQVSTRGRSTELLLIT